MFEHQFLHDLPLYAVGALSGEEERSLEQHLSAGCEICINNDILQTDPLYSVGQVAKTRMDSFILSRIHFQLVQAHT